jgi:hypothetical protein
MASDYASLSSIFKTVADSTHISQNFAQDLERWLQNCSYYTDLGKIILVSKYKLYCMFEKPHLHIWLLSGQSFNQKGFSEEEKTNKQTHLIHGQLDRQSIGAVYTYNSM